MRDGMDSSDMYFFENLSSFIFKRFGKIRDLGNVHEQQFFLDDSSKKQLTLPIIMMMFGGLSMVIIENCVTAFHTRKKETCLDSVVVF